jgi:CRP-like cAMP-binding protein
MEVQRFKQFSTVVRKGEHGDAMYLILEGELRAFTVIRDKETTLTTMGVGDFFGEISLLDQGPRSASVAANVDSVLLRIPATSFDRLVREAPALATLFIYSLSRSIVSRVRILTRKYEDSILWSRTAGGA